MSIAGFGFNSYMQFVREDVWGTYKTVTKKVPVYSFNVKSLGSRLRPNLLNGSIAQPDLVKGIDACEVTVSMPLTYIDQMQIFDCFMGTSTYASSGGVTTGTLPYTHTWSAFKSLTNSLSMEFVEGDIPTGKCIRVVGAKIKKATIKCAAGLDVLDQIARLDLVLIGASMSDPNTNSPTSLSYNTFNPVMQQHLTVLTDVSSGTLTTDWELTIDTMVKERAFLESVSTISEPQRSGRPQWTLSMTREYQSRSATSAFLANTGQFMQTTFALSSNAQFLVGSTSANNTYGKMEKFPEAPVEDDGWIKQKLVFSGEGNASSGNACTLDMGFVNTQATITT